MKKNETGFFEELTEYVKSVQTLDLFTVQEDDIRTFADRRSLSGPLSAEERDSLLNTKFYTLVQRN